MLCGRSSFILPAKVPGGESGSGGRIPDSAVGGWVGRPQRQTPSNAARRATPVSLSPSARVIATASAPDSETPSFGERSRAAGYSGSSRLGVETNAPHTPSWKSSGAWRPTREGELARKTFPGIDFRCPGEIGGTFRINRWQRSGARTSWAGGPSRRSSAGPGGGPGGAPAGGGGPSEDEDWTAHHVMDRLRYPGRG